MPALFDQAAAVEHQDLIGVHYRRQPVRDDQLRPALTRHGEVAHDLGLGRAVERRCGFIEDEDPRVLEIGPRDRQPLPLAARELQPPVTHDRLVLQRQGFDEIRKRRHPRGLADLRIRGILAGVADIGVDGIVEQHAVLRYHPQRVSSAVQPHRPQVLTIDPDGALGGVVEPQQQLLDRRLACARRPDQRGRPPALGGKIQPAQHLPLGGIVKAHMLESQRPRSRRQIRRPRLVGDGVRHFEQRHHPLGVAQTVEDPPVDDPQPAQRLEQPQDQRRHCHEAADGQRPGRDLRHRQRQQDHQRPAQDQRDGHLPQHEIDRHLHRPAAIILHGGVHGPRLPGFGGEGLHRLGVAQPLDNQVRDPILGLVDPPDQPRSDAVKQDHGQQIEHHGRR